MSQESQSGQQPFDSTIKAMLKEDAAWIIPQLIPGTVFLEVLDIEVVRSNLRTDRAYRTMYGDEPHILQLEFQTGADESILRRLLVYHASLWYDHEIPIVSVVVYLFPCVVPKSPFREHNWQGDILTFHFQMICMWKQDARLYVEKQAVNMYPLLPTMSHADTHLLLQAIDELIQCYRGAEHAPLLARRFLWFGVFLRRSETVSEKDKKEVKKRLDTFEYLLEHDPYLKQRDLRNITKGEQIGIQKGQIGEAQRILLNIIRVRFPGLYLMAEPLVMRISQIDVLNNVIECFVTTPDEATARKMLEDQLSI